MAARAPWTYPPGVRRLPAVLLVLAGLGLPAAARAGPPAAGAPAPGTLQVPVGQQRVLDRPGIARVSVGDPGIAQVTPVAGHQVLVTGVAPGRTTLILWFEGGRRETRDVVVRDPGRLGEVEGVLGILGLSKALTVRPAGRGLVVEGTLLTLTELRRFDQLRQAEPGLVTLVKVAPDVYRRLADQITAALHRAGLAGAQATAVGTTVFLEGTVTDAGARQQAGDIARAIWGRIRTGRLETR